MDKLTLEQLSKHLGSEAKQSNMLMAPDMIGKLMISFDKRF